MEYIIIKVTKWYSQPFVQLFMVLQKKYKSLTLHQILKAFWQKADSFFVGYPRAAAEIMPNK